MPSRACRRSGVFVRRGPVLVIKRPRRLARARRERLAKAAARSLRRGRECAAEPAQVDPGHRNGCILANGVPESPDISCPYVEGTEPKLNFSSPREFFCSLIAPLTEDEFFNTHWEKDPLLLKRGRNSTKLLPRHCSLFTLSALRDLVEKTPILFGRHVNVCRYKSGRKVSYGCQGEQLTGALLEKLWMRKKATVQFFQPQQFQVSL